MSVSVRVFYHSGLTTAHVAAGTKFATDSVAMLKQPYLARDKVSATTGAAVSTAAAPAGTRVAYVQVEDGKSVYFEVNPENRTTAADSSSPVVSGSATFECGPNWSLSFLEHATS